jgi:hypothetical protein
METFTSGVAKSAGFCKVDSVMYESIVAFASGSSSIVHVVVYGL